MGKVQIVNCGLAVAATIFLGLCTAHAASGDPLASAIVNCSAQPDDKAQLACYNSIAAQLKAEAAMPAQESAVPALTPPVAAQPATPSAPPAASAPADFGRDTIPFQAGASDVPASIQAGVAHVSFNFFHRFTVVLDNGQVWRQAESDTATAPFDTSKHQVVTIKSGFLGSFHLTIQDQWGSFAVKRIK